jgi:hypothetical protein
MTPANYHVCPGCTFETIPTYRALCRECFDTTPWRMRSDFMHAYRRRVLHQTAYQECLIDVRQWQIRLKAHAENGAE